MCADLITSQNGGKIVVEVSSTGVTSGPCDKDGFPLYARMMLRETLPHGESCEHMGYHRIRVWRCSSAADCGVACGSISATSCHHIYQS